jgi:hypothetical protein
MKKYKSRLLRHFEVFERSRLRKRDTRARHPRHLVADVAHREPGAACDFAAGSSAFLGGSGTIMETRCRYWR